MIGLEITWVPLFKSTALLPKHVIPHFTDEKTEVRKFHDFPGHKASKGWKQNLNHSPT